MAASTTDALFVTANVGSIFEDPTSMLKIWCEEFLAAISQHAPKFVALHCQEVGGKNYERSMQHVSDFVKLLMSSEELKLFNKVRIYLDEDYSSAEHFTALGNFYFIHESIPDENVQIFNFQENKFEPVLGKEVFSENIEDIPTKEKSKFPQEIFPECKWSRKGFMRSRWNLNGTIFDLVNIHLFHDASNFVAMESFPSVYCKNRQRALEHTLKRFHTDHYGTVPFFVFGDFNFRTDTQGVVKKLSEGLNAVKVPSSKSTDHAKLQYRDESSQQIVLTLGKKEFSHQNHQKLFVGGDSDWLREFDREFESFSGELFEFDINFPPTYPYVEDSERGEMYMQTRCPSWCDRVFLSASARMLVDSTDEDSTPAYGLIGLNSCMGDHKPVFLRAALLGGLGTVSCCALPAAPCTSCLSAASPLEHICRLCAEQTVESPSFPLFAEPEQDHSGLVVPQFHRHTSPYTPDSTDTEPDVGEELSPREEPLFLNLKKDRSVNLFDAPSWKDLQSSTEIHADQEDNNISRGAPSRRSASKIPVRLPDLKSNNSVITPHVSKIPVPKHFISKQEKDLNVKGRNGKHENVAASSSKDNVDKRLGLKNDDSVGTFSHSAEHGEINSSNSSMIPKSRSVEGRKNLCRQRNIDENSSDSDTASVDLDREKYSMSEQRTEDSTVEIHFSLVETSPILSSPIDCASDGLLTTQVHGLGGSTTDSGVSVSPDLSVATSPSTDGHDKVALEQVSNVDSNEEDELKGESNPSALERFAFVRRIQSASAMERKSSFPLPSSIFIENEQSLSGFGGSGSNLWGMRTCRCMSDGSWRQRSSTISHSMLSSKTDSRIRLISTSSHLDRSLPRLQSHHSSSDEEWFEEIANESRDKFKSDYEKNFVKEESEVKHTAEELIRRLTTHQECEKVSDLNMSTNIGNDNADLQASPENLDAPLRTQIHTQSLSKKVESALPDNLSTYTSTTFSEKLIKSKEILTSGTVKSQALSVLVEVKEGSTIESTEKNSPQEERSEEMLNIEKPSSSAEETLTRRCSVISSSSKAVNSSSCKACCNLL